MKREKTKLRQAVRRLSVCAARLAEETDVAKANVMAQLESGAADVRSVKELAAVLRELTALGRALEQEEEKDETVRVVLTEEVEPWSE